MCTYVCKNVCYPSKHNCHSCFIPCDVPRLCIREDWYLEFIFYKNTTGNTWKNKSSKILHWFFKQKISKIFVKGRFPIEIKHEFSKYIQDWNSIHSVTASVFNYSYILALGGGGIVNLNSFVFHAWSHKKWTLN